MNNRKRGQVLVFVAACMVGLLGMVGLTLDLSLLYGQQLDVDTLARQAAAAGANENVFEGRVTRILDGPAILAANTFLDQAGVPAQERIAITVSPDHTSVTVHLHREYRPILLRVVGVQSIPIDLIRSKSPRTIL